jgi:antibiotic biosynthesis monooxygenase (ABM) superfamily enzyme
MNYPTWYIIMLVFCAYVIGIPIFFGNHTVAIALMLITVFIVVPISLYLFIPEIEKFEKEIEEAAPKIIKKG